MLFTDDTDAALQAAVALVNSTDEPGEPLGSVDDLSAFLASWPYTGRHDATADELESVRRLRPALRSLQLQGPLGSLLSLPAHCPQLGPVLHAALPL